MKIDAEGSESKILQGGTRILEQYEPIVAMELLKDAGEKGWRAAEVLLEMRYSAFRIGNDGALFPVSMDDIQSEEIFVGEGFANLVFKRK